MDILFQLYSELPKQKEDCVYDFAEEIKRSCERYGVKFLGLGWSRLTVLYEGKCYKLVHTLKGRKKTNDNFVEWQLSRKIKKTEYSEFFALPIKRINRFISEVEYVDGQQCKTLKQPEFNLIMREAEAKRYLVSEKIGVFIFDIHEENVMVTKENKVKIVDFGTIS